MSSKLLRKRNIEIYYAMEKTVSLLLRISKTLKSRQKTKNHSSVLILTAFLLVFQTSAIQPLSTVHPRDAAKNVEGALLQNAPQRCITSLPTINKEPIQKDCE